jgi:hypothetical protein
MLRVGKREVSPKDNDVRGFVEESFKRHLKAGVTLISQENREVCAPDCLESRFFSELPARPH